ncbi:MAG TPA: TRAP transporter substrate-binding protein, partial [Firmicutes bacterium]|nr:TRAP transporter substrate-binding protein [Bacillota bacterium]
EHPGVKILWLFCHDVGQLVSTNKPIKTLEDLKGLRLRSPSATLNPVVEAWGAIPVNLPMSELYEALQKGVVDCTIAPLSSIYDFNLSEVVNYATFGDFYVCTFFMAMNEDTWNSLSPEDQKVFEGIIGKEMAIKAGEAYDHGGQLGLGELEKKGVPIYNLPDEELARWKEAIAPIVDEWIADKEAKGLPGREVYEKAVQLSEKYR